MALSLRMSVPLAGGLLLLLAACPGDKGDDGTTTVAASSTGDGGTTDASTAPQPTTDMPPATGETTDTPATTDPDSGDTTAAETTGGSTGLIHMETTLGTIVIALDEEAAPITSANFLAYVESGFFDGTDGLGATTFHRVVPGFVIQGGGLTEDLMSKPTMSPIVNESGNGLVNNRGTLSMARTANPDSATSQFFINLVDNGFLDEPPGYAVFGEVVEGMEVVDAIAAVETTDMLPYEDVPVEPVIITSVTVQ